MSTSVNSYLVSHCLPAVLDAPTQTARHPEVVNSAYCRLYLNLLRAVARREHQSQAPLAYSVVNFTMSSYTQKINDRFHAPQLHSVHGSRTASER